MANTIEVVITASDKASPVLENVNSALDGTAAAATAAGVAYDKTAAIAHRLELATMQMARAQQTLASETDPMKQAALRVEIDNLAKSQDTLQKELRDSAQSTDDLNNSLEKTDDAAEEADGGLTKMMNVLKAAGVVAAAMKFGKMAVELGELGAQAQRTEQGFATISGGSLSAAANLEAMMQATDGAIDRTTAMGLANQMMQMGLADSAEALGRNAEMATRLGRAMGVDATTAMTNWNAMMANQSIQRLDTFGISSSKVRTRIEEMMAATEGLSREQAFTNAVMEVGAEAMDRLGDSTQDAALQIEQSKAALTDLKGEIGMAFTDAVAGSESTLGKFTRAWGDNLRVMRQSGGEIGRLEGNVGMLRDALGATNTVFDKFREMEALNLHAAASGAAALAQGFSDVGASAPEAASAIAKVTDGSFDLYWRMRNVETASLGLEDVTYGSAEAWRDYQAAIDGANASTQQFDTGSAQSQLEDVASAAQAAQDQVDLISWGAKQTFTEQLEDGKTKIEELRSKAGELQAKITELEGLRYRTSAQEEELSGLREDLGGVNGDIQEVIASTDEMVKRFVLGMVEMQIAADQDITPEESDFYVRLAAQFGLVDDAAIELRGTVLGVLADVQEGAISPEEGIKALADAATDAQAPMLGLEAVGVPALDNLGLAADIAAGKMQFAGDSGATAFGNIEGAARSSTGAIDAVGAAALAAQAKIDAMHGKDIVFRTFFEEHRGVGGAIPEHQFEAEGGDYYVNSPTHFVAGEAGAERAIFIPKGQPGYDMDWRALLSGMAAPLTAPMGAVPSTTGDGGTRIGTVNLTVNGTADAAETARLVMREFQDRGFIPRMPLR